VTVREQIYADIDRVFLNIDEFGEDVTINGIELVCVPYDIDIKNGNEERGLYRGERTIQVKISDLPGKPAVNSRITYQGEPYFLHSCRDDLGMYVIQMGANRT
jgi:hypothetical protein